MRNPAIHIRRSDLIVIIESYGLNIHDINKIMTEAVKYSIKNRVNVTTKVRGKQKAERHIESDTNLVSEFNRIYAGEMILNNVKALSITKSSVQYLTLKEVTFQALEFCKLFSLVEQTGFKIYIDLGLKIL